MAGAPLAYPSRLPVSAIVNALKDAHISLRVINAGAFICNFVYYRLAPQLQSSRRRYGFVRPDRRRTSRRPFLARCRLSPSPRAFAGHRDHALVH
ncbi:MAG: hypothetical protein U1F26_11355 [Lysobacterales bacterium]